MDHAQCPLSRLCLNRRKFLAGSGLGFLGMALASQADLIAGVAGQAPSAPVPDVPAAKARVGLIYSHIGPDRPTWPYINYDYESRKKEITAKLKAACPNTEFVIETALDKETAVKLVKQMDDVDGFITYPVGCWTGAVDVVMHSGKPVLLVDDLYAGTGEFITQYGVAVREKLPVVGIASSNFRDVERAARLFEVMKGIQSAKVLDVTEHDIQARADEIRKHTGIEVIRITADELEAQYQKADAREATLWADKWMKAARKVVEPTRDEIIKSGKMHLAISSLMKERAAEAITIDCLTLFYGNKMSAYPCLSFHQLNNDGFIGACEGDLNSTATMVMMRHLVARPGYISDPVFDTSKSEIIYAHCVAPTKVYGPNGKSNPYLIRTHSEDRKGAVVQSLMPVGETVTTIEANLAEKALVVHTGRTTANIDDEKACRTKLAAKVNLEKIMNNWQWGWHRVTFYGDSRQEVKQLATLMRFRVFEEDV
jgi:L-fucose isomerase-like protein